MHYETTMLTKHDMKLGEYRTNGILAMDGEVCVDAVLDISQQESAVKHLTGLLNHREVSLLHFREVVEDYISVL